MKNITFMAMAVFFLSLSRSFAVETVPYVDLTRYVGKWYEIASIPQSFQKQCASNVTAEYTTLPDGKIKVVNSCLTGQGKNSVAEGRAKVVDPQTQAKLKVTFVKFIDWIFAFGGDYWVIDLEANYRYAVVGHPTKKYGWILAREPLLSRTEFLQIADKLKAQGYDTCKFNTTIQEGGLSTSLPLCKYLE